MILWGSYGKFLVGIGAGFIVFVGAFTLWAIMENLGFPVASAAQVSAQMLYFMLAGWGAVAFVNHLQQRLQRFLRRHTDRRKQSHEGTDRLWRTPLRGSLMPGIFWRSSSVLSGRISGAWWTQLDAQLCMKKTRTGSSTSVSNPRRSSRTWLYGDTRAAPEALPFGRLSQPIPGIQRG